MSPSYRFVVTGRVQAVGFRTNVQGKALSLGLRGWVRNRPDGAVEGLASGEEAALSEFHVWLPRGAPAARVLSVEWEAATEQPPEGFEIRR